MDRTALAVRLAMETWSLLRASFRSVRDVRTKGDGSLVSDVDREAENRILSAITAAFPADAIVAEESGTRAGKSGITWYVDPLDGTTNFISGIPFFATSIAYADADGIRAAAVAIPTLDAMVTAERSEGAFWNGNRMRASDANTTSPYLLSYSDRSDPRVPAFFRAHPNARVLGSAVVSWCLLAAGAADAYIALQQHPWDYAAGILIAAEAGRAAATLSGLSIVRPISDNGVHDIIAAPPDALAPLAAFVASLGHENVSQNQFPSAGVVL